MTLTQKIIAYRKFLIDILDQNSLARIENTATGKQPFCFLENLPIKENIEDQKKYATAIALGIIGLMYLRIVSYKNEYDGSIIHDIMPQPGKESEASSSGRAPLPLHSDMAFLRFPAEKTHPFMAAAPDFLILAGVVNSGNVKTRIVPLMNILNKLTDNEIQTLSSALFDIESPTTVKPQKLAEKVPILFEHRDYGVMLRYNSAIKKIKGRTEKAKQSVTRLSEIFEDISIGEEIDIQPGTVLVFNNRKVVHGRAAIDVKATTTSDRHFKRIYGQRCETETNPMYSYNPFIQAL